MTGLSKAARGLEGSPIRKMFNIANAMNDVISFTVGEPDFPTPINIVEAAATALREGRTHYTPNAGILPLRQAIAESVVSSHGIRPDPERDIIVTAGGMEALMLIMMTLVDAGDEVIVSDPHWPNHVAQVRLCGGTPVFVKAREANGFVLDAEDVRAAMSPKTKILILNSPANPTGAVAGRETLRALADLSVERDLMVISDEVYRHFLYDGAEFASISTFPGMGEHSIIVDSFSKTYAMTGWRVGWALGPENVIECMVKLQENVAACVNTAAQYAAIEALAGTQEPLRLMLAEYAVRRGLLLDGIAGIDRLSCAAPKGAFYAFVDIRETRLGSEAFALRLLGETGVAVVPGSGFGAAGEGYVRMSYATSSRNIVEGLARIKRFISSLP